MVSFKLDCLHCDCHDVLESQGSPKTKQVTFIHQLFTVGLHQMHSDGKRNDANFTSTGIMLLIAGSKKNGWKNNHNTCQVFRVPEEDNHRLNFLRNRKPTEGMESKENSPRKFFDFLLSIM